YRIIILIGIFVASIYYFSKDIKEVVFDFNNTTIMEDATFPLVTLVVGEDEINLLHGYSSNLNANKLREAVTPISRDQSFEINIRQMDYDIKKLNYEIRDFYGNELIESSSVSVFDEQEASKIAKIKFREELATGKEYAVKITLISSKSQKMYYYTRIKLYADAHLHDQITFVKDFHNAIKNKNDAKNIRKYLEYNSKADNTTLAYVNIHSDFELITWGSLNPEIITDVVPTIVEVYPDIAHIRLDYYISAELEGNIEYYRVMEFYRIRYSTNRMYLLNYERFMESLFDVNLASVSKSELKLGISSDYELPSLASTDQTKLAFVRNQELWLYHLDKNEIIKVFSFVQEESDYIRDRYNQHDIRILNMDNEGNMDFVVYGYMNRGNYEGKVAIILYHYVRAENRIEEMVYIPLEEPYQTLKENIGRFAYVNSKDVFYLHMNSKIYSYDLITHKLSELANSVYKDQVVVFEDKGIVAWQNNSDPKLAETILIMDMESGEIRMIETLPGYSILLMDKIDSNIIYGFVEKENIITHVDGRVLAPLSVVEIASLDKKVLKRYEESGYYISDIEVKENIVELFRVQKIGQGEKVSYTPVANDYILNQIKELQAITQITTRVTDKALTELYLDLPSSFNMEVKPTEFATINTIIFQDPTVRLSDMEHDMVYYYPYIMGDIAGAYKELADGVNIANDNAGVVVNNKMQLVWERGIKSNSYTLDRFENMDWEVSSSKTMDKCMELLRNDKINRGLYSEFTPLRLTGISLDDALYYIYTDRPVVAMTNREDGVLIYGYNAFNILIINPKSQKVEKMGLQDANDLFQQAGNVFISYLD
ncbi:MAG TPA: hypothetical protein GX731_06725, partial [Clostridiales bacterium]|nr:hypothetical protein [Clostridiales bacterium]